MSNAVAVAAVTGVGPSSSTSPRVVRTGTLSVRERTTFGGRVWKSKGVVLDENSLTIHQSSSTRHTRLLLRDITELERTDLMPHSLSIQCSGKLYHFAFDTDADLYDWRDDMYCRCPLGAQTTGPFNFQHTAHIGANGASGTFTEPSTLPMYEEMMGRSISATGVASAPAMTTRTRSGQSGTARRRSNPMKGHVMLNNNNNINVEGAYFVKQTGMFVGWYWKERWLSLKGSLLTVHTRKTKASPPAKEIPLSTITSVEPDSKRSNCLLVATTKRETCLCILFPSDGDLYAWREVIYLRSGHSALISSPTNFVHNMHVGFNKATGEFTGLPEHWKNLLYPTNKSQGKPAEPAGSRTPRRRSYPRGGEVSTSHTPEDPFLAFSSASPLGSFTHTQDNRHNPLLSSGGFVPTPFGSQVKGTPGSPSSQFLAGTSASSDGTLVNVSTPIATSSHLMREKIDGLGGLNE